MKHILASAILIVSAAVGALADLYPRQPAVDVVHYDISLELTDFSDTVTAITQVHVRAREDGLSRMWLDFEDMKVDRLSVGGVETPFEHRGGRLSFGLGKTYSRNEILVIEVRYHGRPKSGMVFGTNSLGRRVLFTDCWPDRAHHWFPSIDHPSDKATVDITVTAPEKYDVVSNGRLVQTLSLLDGRRRTQWSESRPIPTYSVAVGVAEFSVCYNGDTDGVPLVWYSYPPHAEAAERKFRRTALALDYFRRTIGPYPFEKLAQVEAVLKTGAMENAGAIFYDESHFLGDAISEYPVPHEIAHQWFGNSVTPADWDHLWLSEGFASYFEALFYEHLAGIDALRQIMASYAGKVEQYPQAGTRPVIDPGMPDLMLKLNPLTYEKGAWILHMLRGILGDETFFRGIRRYYELYQGANASTEDFRMVMEWVSGKDLGVFFRQWLYRPASPEYRVSWRWDEAAGEAIVDVRQVQTEGLFDMPLEIAFCLNERCEKHRFRVAEPFKTLRVPLAAEPSSVEIDPEGWVLKRLSGPE